MINIDRALRSERLLKALTGQSIAEFKALLPTFLDVVIPHKSSKNHPLSPDQKDDNRVISSGRILAEHALAGVKRFRCLTDTYRNKSQLLADQFMLLACGLWNFHLRLA